jgi:hypothetical protein
MSNDPDQTQEKLEQSYAQLGDENARLRDEIGPYKAASEETEEERHRRWGAELLAGLTGEQES